MITSYMLANQSREKDGTETHEKTAGIEGPALSGDGPLWLHH